MRSIAFESVLQNNVVVGSVNANQHQGYKVPQNLARADGEWLSRLVSRRERPEESVRAIPCSADDIKVATRIPKV